MTAIIPLLMMVLFKYKTKIQKLILSPVHVFSFFFAYLKDFVIVLLDFKDFEGKADQL